MKILVISDSHMEKDSIDFILKTFNDIDIYLHCGDIVLDKSHYPIFHTVKGNHDDEDYPIDKIIETDNLKIYMTHGHKFSENTELLKWWKTSDKTYEDYKEYIRKMENEMIKEAKKYDAKMVCYGHTHMKNYRKSDDIHVLNPGSVMFNCDGTLPSFAIITLLGNDIEINFYEIDIEHLKISLKKF